MTLVRRFWLDVLSTVPMDMIAYNVGGQSTFQQFHIMGILRVGRLPRLLQLIRLANLLRLLRIRAEVRQWLIFSRYSHLIRLVSLIVMFLTMLHFVTCIWNGVAAIEHWPAEAFGVEDVATPGDLYVLSFYYSMMTILGQSLPLKTIQHFIFSCIFTVIGSLTMAIVFGNVAVLLANFYENENGYKKKVRMSNGSLSLWSILEMDSLDIYRYLSIDIYLYCFVLADRRFSYVYTIDGNALFEHALDEIADGATKSNQ
jgi:hypothetical protein